MIRHESKPRKWKRLGGRKQEMKLEDKAKKR